jgi:tetratricopeptide (TPR) repeat protein
LDGQDSFGAAFGRLMKRKRGTRVTQAQLACLLYPNLGEDAEKRKGDISKLESGKVPNPNAATVRKIADALGITDEEIETLQRRALAPLSDQLQEIPVLSRDELELLASRFELDRPHTHSNTALKEFLTKKAADYRQVRADIEAIPETMLRLSNIKAAAKAAFAAGDMDEVESLLSMVQAVEVEEAARTAESRADVALLRGRVDEAFRLLSAAADFFAIVDPTAPGSQRSNYVERLVRHGQRFGGTGLAWSVQMGRDAVARLDRTTAAAAWATANQNLAVALWQQGTRTGVEAGTALLTEAVAAYRQALEVSTRADHPVDWAMTMQNLAGALWQQGTRTGGEAGTALLAQAVAAYRQALQVSTRADHPVQWAGTMQNLAIALRNQGIRTGGEAGTALLAQAVAAYRQALEVRTRADHPVDWAMTMQNLANALRQQGTRTGAEAGTALLAQAVAAYRQALEVRTRADHPVQWAMTMQNLANALQEQGTRTGGEAGTALLAQAVAAYRQALEVRTRADHPVDWAMTQENMAICELSWAEHPACDDPLPHLRAALDHVDAALTVYDPVHMPYDHGTATALRAEILAALNAS